MFRSLQDKLAKQAIEALSPEEVLRLAENYLPELMARWSKEERVQLVQQLLEKHLPTLIGDLSSQEKSDLVRSLLPTLLKAFPLDGVDLLSLLS
jgi:Mg/Co/Ni transporter MgtE